MRIKWNNVNEGILSTVRHYTADDDDNDDDNELKVGGGNHFKSKDVFTNRAKDSNHTKVFRELCHLS